MMILMLRAENMRSVRCGFVGDKKESKEWVDKKEIEREKEMKKVKRRKGIKEEKWG